MAGTMREYTSGRPREASHLKYSAPAAFFHSQRFQNIFFEKAELSPRGGRESTRRAARRLMRHSFTWLLFLAAPLSIGMAELESAAVSAPVPASLGGEASWYGPRFHGRLTANGEVYDMFALTAAHRILPFGSVLRVLDPSSGRSVVVRINDRGPFIGDRVLDLSFAAARELGMVHQGLARVEIELLEPLSAIEREEASSEL